MVGVMTFMQGNFANGAVTGAFGYLFNDMLHYDGKKLRWTDDNGKVVSEYGAVSGRDGYQSAEFQSEVGTGPIPEGLYFVGQDQLQLFSDLTVADQIAAHWPFGKVTSWPGGQVSWGEQRVWLSPANGDFFGRSGFSIHGGWYPGSAGCIDLTGQMGGFASQFRNYGNDMWLRVKY